MSERGSDVRGDGPRGDQDSRHFGTNMVDGVGVGSTRLSDEVGAAPPGAAAADARDIRLDGWLVQVHLCFRGRSTMEFMVIDSWFLFPVTAT